MLEADLFKPIADELEEAGVLLIGYAGGGAQRFANTEVSSLEEIQGLKIRVQGAPIWSSTFAAIGMSPTVIAYNEVYNAIQNDVISAGENEAAGVEQMKFYEVAPNLAMTRHAITIRPLCFSRRPSIACPRACSRRSCAPARKRAPTAARSNPRRMPPSSTPWSNRAS